MDTNTLITAITNYVENYSRHYYSDVLQDEKLKEINTKYVEALNFLDLLLESDKDKFNKTIDALINSQTKEIGYFVTSYLILKDVEDADVFLDKLNKKELNTKLGIRQLSPFRIYAKGLFKLFNLEYEYEDPFLDNQLFNTESEMQTFISYFYLDNPFKIKSLKQNKYDVKSLSDDLFNLLHLSIFNYYATHKSDKEHVDIFKLFFNNHHAEFNYDAYKNNLYPNILKALKSVGEERASQILEPLVNLSSELVSKSSNDYALLYKDLSFIGERDEDFYNGEKLLENECPKLTTNIINFIKRVCKNNNYLSKIDKQSDNLVKKIKPLLYQFHNRNFAVGRDIHNILMEAYRRDEELLDATINKIKDYRDDDALALCYILNLGGNDILASTSYVKKYIAYDPKAKKELGMLGFNFSKFIRYSLSTKDIYKDVDLLNKKDETVIFGYKKLANNLIDIVGYIYNRWYLLTSNGVNVEMPKEYLALDIVNTYFIYYLQNNSIDSAIRIVYNSFDSFELLRSSMEICGFKEELEILNPVLTMIEKEIAKNTKSVVKGDLNLEELLDTAQFIKIRNIQERLQVKETYEEYISRLSDFATKIGLLA